MEASVWLSNAPHGCWTKPDLTPAVAEQGEDGAREMLAAFGFVPSALIVPECGGFVEATLPDAAGCACGEATIYPFFIGEAAYYEKGKDMAFMLARKETLKVCGVCVVPPSSE